MPLKRLIPLLLCLVFLLSGCTSTGLPVTESEPAATLPPAEITYAAPIGDAMLDYNQNVQLFLPDRDGIGLVSLDTELSFSLVRPAAETLMRALISQNGTKTASALGGNVRLSLYGANPVEVSRDVATVNLSASALQLDRKSLFIACQAIANTLTALDEINHVNVLVVDKPIGLDIANTLPMGTLSYHAAQDLAAVHDQLLAKRAAHNSTADATPLASTITLYFPLKNSDGLICEARTINFESQNSSDMAVAILRELAAGPSDPGIHSPALPLLADLLTEPPTVTASTESGGSIISLDFTHNLDDMLEAYGLDRMQCISSLCYTLSTFFPNTSGITVSINGKNVLSQTEIGQVDQADEDIVFQRSEFSSLLYDYCTLYFVDENAVLAPSKRAISYYQCTNPRVLLCELAKGPLADDSLPNLKPVMAQKAITDTSLLGFALAKNTLLVNFAPSFAQLGNDISPAEERHLAYALVNTLCANHVVRNVCFFQSGAQFDGFTPEIYWRGIFHPLPN